MCSTSAAMSGPSTTRNAVSKQVCEGFRARIWLAATLPTCSGKIRRFIAMARERDQRHDRTVRAVSRAHVMG